MFGFKKGGLRVESLMDSRRAIYQCGRHTPWWEGHLSEWPVHALVWLGASESGNGGHGRGDPMNNHLREAAESSCTSGRISGKTGSRVQKHREVETKQWC